MCEMLVRIVDREAPDAQRLAAASKAGDVIVVCPDDWKWGYEELANAEWRIVKFPGVPVENMTDFTRQDTDVLGKTVRFRATALSVDLVAELVASDKPVTLTKTDFDKDRVDKPFASAEVVG